MLVAFTVEGPTRYPPLRSRRIPSPPGPLSRARVGAALARLRSPLRGEPPMRTLNSLIVPLLAVFTALVLGAVVIAATGGNAALAYQGLWEGSFGRARSISDTL